MLRFTLAAAAALLSTSAFAHAGLSPAAAANGSTTKVAITIPHGCDGAATDKVTVRVPEGFVSAKPQVKAGWQVEIETGDYARSYEVHGQPVTAGPVAVTWSGGSVPDGQFDEFVLQGTVSSETALAFVTTQYCGTASEAWDQIAAEGQNPHALERPAPVLAIGVAEAGHDPHAGHDMVGMETTPPPTTGAPVTLGELEISAAFSRATLPNAPVGGGYLTITNNGAADDRLVSVATPVAGKSEIHEMRMEGEVMKMNALPDGVVIPAGGTVSLQPGGYHLMFMDLQAPLVEGESFPVTLTFEKAGSVEVEVEIGSPAAKAPAQHSALTSTKDAA